MCGIVGFADRGQRYDSAHLGRAMDVLRRRGPDDSGAEYTEHQDVRIGFGHRRLSIRDLSSAGRQPFVNEAGDCFLTSNGEIYNADELRRDLELCGHRFVSSSDCEVILHGYEEYGVEIVERLNGMFAFAIWDQRRGRVVMARDRLGIKPLLYCSIDGSLIFASELEALLHWPGVGRTVDVEALHEYLMFGYTLAPRTIIEGIRKLEPGHLLIHDVVSGHQELRKYWNLAAAFRQPFVAADPEAELWRRLSDSVDLRRASDVPLGSFLSGGVDSATISAILGHQEPGARVFCSDFAEHSFSEGQEARRAARSLGLDFHHQMVTPLKPEDVSGMIRAADEPFADTSFVATHRLSEFARQDVTVILSGDGADELLAGYVTYQAGSLHRYLSGLPAGVRSWLSGPVAQRIQADSRKVGWRFKARQFLHAADQSPERAHGLWRCLWWPGELSGLLRPSVVDELERRGSDPLNRVEQQFDAVRDLPFLQQSLYVDLTTWMVDDILHKVDRASMAHGLEVRVPFLDHRFVEWCAAVPTQLKLRGRTGKWLLRHAARRHCPELRFQRKKQGFNVPVGHWFRTTLEPWVQELQAFASESCSRWLEPQVLERVVSEHQHGVADHTFRLWGMFCLLEWLRQHDVELPGAGHELGTAGAVSLRPEPTAPKVQVAQDQFSEKTA